MQKEEFIYRDMDKYMVRVPMLSSEDYEQLKSKKNLIEIDELINRLCSNAVFREAILAASESLYNKMDSFLNGKIEKDKKLDDFRISILKYYIRMCTRTTPFGLFSCVGEGSFSKCKSGSPQIVRKRKIARPDFEWIMKLVKSIENRSYQYLSYKANPIVYHKGNRVALPYITGTEDIDINMRNSRPVSLVYKLCKEESRSYSFLLEYLHNEYKAVSMDVLHSTIKELIDKEILISNLRPPLSKDELSYITQNMKGVPGLEDDINKLVEISRLINQYNHMEIGSGETILLKILDKMKTINTASTYLQIDSAFESNNGAFDQNTSEDIKSIVDFIFKAAIINGNRQTIYDEYKMDFIEKYGEDRDVALCEMMDNDFGIGAPYSYLHPYAGRNRKRPNFEGRENEISYYLWDKYNKAIMNGTSIVITDDIFNLSSSDTKAIKEYPLSMEINLICKKVNGVKTYYLGPNIGSTAAGKTFGRFTHLEESYQTLCSEIDSLEEEAIDKDTVICELSYIPQRTRLGNVVRNGYERKYEIVFYTNGTKDQVYQIPIEDIFVGIEHGNFCLKSKRLNRKLKVRTNNMLNVLNDANIIRFLKEIEQYETIEWSDFIWNRLFGDLPYIPEIRYKNIILCAETWKISSAQLSCKDYELFEKTFNEYRTERKLPHFVYLSDADNRLLIDLETSYGLKILYKTLKKEKSIKLTACERGEDYFCDKNGNHYCCEIVVPMIRQNYKDKRKTQADYTEKNLCVDFDNRYKMFGSDWIYLKLYGAGAWQENLIMYYIKQFSDSMVNDQKIDKYFFMRYADPEFHIRLRMQGHSIMNYLPEIADWLADLCKQGVIARYEIGCYEREIERYGGVYGIDIAEEIFWIDSKIAADMLYLIKENKLTFDKELIGVISAIFYMEQFGWKFSRQLNWLNSFIEKTDYKVEYNKVKKQYERICDSDDNWKELSKNEEGILLIQLINTRESYVKRYREAIDKGLITTSEETIVGSLIHLSFNRLFGIDREFEKKILSFARHTLYSLRFKKEHLHERNHKN